MMNIGAAIGQALSNRGAAIGQSLTVHVVVVAVAWFGLPHLTRDLSFDQPVLTVDIVEVTPETNLEEGIDANPDPVEESPPEEAPPPDTPPPPPSPTAPPAPAAEAEPVPTPELAADSPPEKPDVKPVKATKVAAPPRPPREKSPDYKKRQQQQAVLTSKLQDLTRRTEEQRRRQEEEDDEKKKAQEKLAELVDEQRKQQDQAEKDEAKEKLDELVGQALNTPRRTSATLGISDIDRLRSHLATCWSPPPGAARANTLIVDIIVRLDAQAVVQSVRIKDESRFKREEAYRAAANAARRAVFACSPLPLPLESYEEWKELEIAFDPRFITRS